MLPLAVPTTRPPSSRKGRRREPQFVVAATLVMAEFHSALRALVSATPGTIRTAADFHRAMGVDAKLGWQVYRIAHAESHLSSGLEVPSAVSMRKLFKAAVKQRVPEVIVKRASRAFEEFESLVHEHAGDRDSFASMVGAVTA